MYDFLRVSVVSITCKLGRVAYDVYLFKHKGMCLLHTKEEDDSIQLNILIYPADVCEEEIHL